MREGPRFYLSSHSSVAPLPVPFSGTSRSSSASVTSSHLCAAAAGRVCPSGWPLTAEGAVIGVHSLSGREENTRERRHPASGGHTAATRSSSHHPGCFKGADPSRGLFRLRRWMAAKSTNPPLRALIKGRHGGCPWRMWCAVNLFRCRVPFITRLPGLQAFWLHSEPAFTSSHCARRGFCTP